MNCVKQMGNKGDKEGLSNYVTLDQCEKARMTEEESVVFVKDEQKYAVLLVAGQSNAVGYDESPIIEGWKIYRSNRIKQLGLYGEDNLKIIPLKYCAQNFQDMTPYGNPNSQTEFKGTKGIHTPLANLLLNNIPDDYVILIIPCAYGGTGFTLGGSFGTFDEASMKPTSLTTLRWGIESAYYKSMVARVKYTLNLNDGNVFLGTVWIQGEHDNQNPEGHLQGFNEMTMDFFNQMNKAGFGRRVKSGAFSKDQWYNVQSTPYWSTQGQYKAILENYKAWNLKTYVEINADDINDTNATNGTGSTTSNRPTHFGNDAFFRVVAPEVYKKMKENQGLFF